MEQNIASLIGKTLVSATSHNDEVNFITSCGLKYRLYHEQDCCESVTIESIVGCLDDLVGNPILMAESPSSEGYEATNDFDESFTWTFYKFATVKGYVDIRWYGTSNGWYSESVRLEIT